MTSGTHRRARPSRAFAVIPALASFVGLPAVAAADEVADMKSPPAEVETESAQLPYTVPRQTLIPGTPGMPGGFHLMINGFAEAQNTGISGHPIANTGVRTFDAGTTYPLLVDDWAMAYGRDERGCGTRSTRTSSFTRRWWRCIRWRVSTNGTPCRCEGSRGGDNHPRSLCSDASKRESPGRRPLV